VDFSSGLTNLCRGTPNRNGRLSHVSFGFGARFLANLPNQYGDGAEDEYCNDQSSRVTVHQIPSQGNSLFIRGVTSEIFDSANALNPMIHILHYGAEEFGCRNRK